MPTTYQPPNGVDPYEVLRGWRLPLALPTAAVAELRGVLRQPVGSALPVQPAQGWRAFSCDDDKGQGRPQPETAFQSRRQRAAGRRSGCGK